jgi:hypothetical protein
MQLPDAALRRRSRKHAQFGTTIVDEIVRRERRK